MEKVTGDVRAKGGVDEHRLGVPRQPQRRHRAGDAALQVQGRVVRGGGRAVRGRRARSSTAARSSSGTSAPPTSQKAAADLGLQIVAVGAAPSVKTHPVRAPRVAILHTWLDARRPKAGGGRRSTTRRCRSPTSARSTSRSDDNLNAKFDVIVFPPVGRGTEAIVNGMPMWGNPLPWKKTPETPNLGSEDQTDDMRPGLGWTGVAHLQDFVRKGGLLLTVDGHRRSRGRRPASRRALRRRAPAAAHRRQRRALEDGRRDQPDRVRLHRQPRDLVRQRPDLQRLEHVRRRAAGGASGRDDGGNRPTGRGTADDPDVPQGRPGVERAGGAEVDTWQAVPVTDEQLRNGINVIPPARAAARHPALRRHARPARVGPGRERRRNRAARRRSSTCRSTRGTSSCSRTTRSGAARPQGSYFLVFNALLNFDQLDAGRKLDAR